MFKVGDKVRITNTNSVLGFIQRAIGKTGKIVDNRTELTPPWFLINFNIEDSKEIWNNMGGVESLWFLESELEPYLRKGEQLLLAFML